MNKLLLAFCLLAAGAGAFHSARQYSTQLQQREQMANESWQTHTQQLALAQSEQAALTERIRELKQTPAQSQAASGSALWVALRTHRADRLPPELRQQTLAELGFDWRTSPDFVVVSKQAVCDLQMLAVRNGQLTVAASAVLALTPEERARVAETLERVKTDLRDWAVAHVERNEPTDEVLAYYTLPQDPKMSPTIIGAFATRLAEAVGRERAELIIPTAREWMKAIGVFDRDAKPAMMSIRRVLVGNEQRLNTETSYDDRPATETVSQPLYNHDRIAYPRNFHFIFPNGWADVAQREGFELPPSPEKK
jgi:hypothetical protein